MMSIKKFPFWELFLYFIGRPNAEVSGDFAVIMGRLRPDYRGKIVRSSDWLARSEAERLPSA